MWGGRIILRHCQKSAMTYSIKNKTFKEILTPLHYIMKCCIQKMEICMWVSSHIERKLMICSQSSKPWVKLAKNLKIKLNIFTMIWKSSINLVMLFRINVTLLRNS